MANEEKIEISYTDELQEMLGIAKHPRTIALLKDAVTNATREGTSVSAQNGSASMLERDAVSQQAVKRSIRPDGEKSVVPTTKISSYGWDQSDRYVKIYITMKDLSGLKQENIKSRFTDSSMEVELMGLQGKNHVLVINGLLLPIVPEQCSVKVKSGSVIVSLRKTSAENWSDLTAREKRLKGMREMKPSTPGKSDDPERGIMDLMRKMYDEGDDEMKRTIKKAWHESQDKKTKSDF